MKKALGRGLSSLIPDNYVIEKNILDKKSTEHTVEGFELIPVPEIAPNPDQPRKNFSKESIEELAASIKEKGILQPVIVKKNPTDETPKYELVCGERRMRAAILAGLEKIPAIVKDLARDDVLEWALIENIQREDLNPLEEARAFERLALERSLPQEEIAKRVGKSRSAVTNSIRLLRLPEEIQGYLRDGRLSSGHARALLGLFSSEHQLQLGKQIIKEGLSVRQTEELVTRSAKKRRARAARRLTPEIEDLERRLSRFFGAPVRIYSAKNSKQGRIVIHYFSLDELDRILTQTHLPPA